MIGNDYPELITPEEAVRIGKNVVATTEANICEDIYREFCRRNEEVKKGLDYFNFLFLLATVWNAGRIQGIREERSKKKGSSRI